MCLAVSHNWPEAMYQIQISMQLKDLIQCGCTMLMITIGIKMMNKLGELIINVFKYFNQLYKTN